ncbi:hypothetical protein [Dendrosporobacter sp. 1207_IL3150]|uniref:hypothetical protein n=1 Tax=Dendrosporobacter sp. 1207_IL3150 TaxID=3084054 RepID=UPI002FD930CA
MTIQRELPVELSEGVCQKCGDKREVFNLSGFLYGERLLLTEDGQCYVYLNCLDDTAFDEINQILKSIIVDRKMSHDQETEYFYKIFGSTCDFVNKAKIDATRTKVSCLSCGSDEISVNEKFPPDVIRVTLPVITHSAWDSMDEQMKKRIIINEFKERCAISS